MRLPRAVVAVGFAPAIALACAHDPPPSRSAQRAPSELEIEHPRKDSPEPDTPPAAPDIAPAAADPSPTVTTVPDHDLAPTDDVVEYRGGGASSAQWSPDAGPPGTPPRLPDGARLACDFPKEADPDDIDHATVRAAVTVSTKGKVVRVKIIQDPGRGFGREAKRCLQGQVFVAGRDASGKPIESTVVMAVHFVR